MSDVQARIALPPGPVEWFDDPFSGLHSVTTRFTQIWG
jgi:hypothetical protein